MRLLLSQSRRKEMVIDGVTTRHSWRDTTEAVFDWLLFLWLGRCLLGAGASVLAQSPVLPAWVHTVGADLDLVAVVLLLPNLLRRYCLFFTTSNIGESVRGQRRHRALARGDLPMKVSPFRALKALHSRVRARRPRR